MYTCLPHVGPDVPGVVWPAGRQVAGDYYVHLLPKSRLPSQGYWIQGMIQHLATSSPPTAPYRT